MGSKNKVCPRCDSVIKGDVCLNCGFVFDKALKIKPVESSKTESKSNEKMGRKLEDHGEQEPEALKKQQKEKPSKKRIDQDKKNEDRKSVRSIFIDIANSAESDNQIQEAVKEAKKSKVFPIILVLILIVLGLLSYWRFIYYVPNYISPLVLSARDVKEMKNSSTEGMENNGASISKLDTSEKAIPLNLSIKEGNFSKTDFVQFAPPDIKLIVHMFDLPDIFEKYLDNDLLLKVQKDFDFTDDDIRVYLSSGFAIMYPNNDMKTWGFVIKVDEKAKDFVDERFQEFKKKKENKDESYKDYYADLVVIGDTDGLDIKSDTEDSKEGGKEDRSAVDKDESNDQGDNNVKSESEGNTDDENKNEKDLSANPNDSGNVNENKDNESVQEGESTLETKEVGAGIYLLVSNSDEFLDHMKESSEGNLPNLSQDIKYAQAKAELPKIGQVLVYKNPDATTWSVFAEWVAAQFDYIGLDKIMKDISSHGLVIHSNGGKVRIKVSESY